jgi:hypothetical protein
MGTSFVVAVFLQTVRGYDAIEIGVIFTARRSGSWSPHSRRSGSPKGARSEP